MLLPKNRDDVGIQVQGQAFELLEAATPNIQQTRVDIGNLLGRVDRDCVKEPADCALDRESFEFSNTLKHFVPNELHHMTGPEYPQHQGIKHTRAHLRRTVIRVTPPTDAHRLQVFAKLVFFKEPADQTRTAESGQILSCELLPRSQILFFLLFLCYICIHFLSASFSGVVGQTYIT